MEEDEDDLYAPAGASNDTAGETYSNGSHVATKEEDEDNKMEGQEDDDDSSGSDSDDVNFITEREDAGATSNQTDFRKAKAEPIRISSAAEPAPSRVSAPTQVKLEPQNRGKITVVDGSKYPMYSSSKVDVNNMPVYDPAGKPLNEVDLDADIAMETKPWRVPGTDPTDFFNYGFDEQTWVAYCLRQKSMREEGASLKEEFKQFQAMGMPGLPAMGGMGDGSEMTPEMFNAMFASMQAQGMTDPSQMDFSMFQQMQQMQQQMGGGFGQNGQQDQNQFMAQQGQGQFGNQQGGGYDGFSPQQMNIMQQQQHHQGGGRGRGRGRKW